LLVGEFLSYCEQTTAAGSDEGRRAVLSYRKAENAPAYCARSGGGKSLATASSAMKTKTPIAK
jgi:hypothetical protein